MPRKILRFMPSLLALAALCAAPAAFAQQDYSKVQIKTEKLSATTYMLVGSGGNIGVSVGADAAFIVDDEFAPLSEKIKAAVAALSDKPIKFVLNTHFHGDHTGGNENFGKVDATIIAHENVRKRMAAADAIEQADKSRAAAPHKALPVLTFADDVTLQLNGDEVLFFHVPHGHTDGDAIVWFKNSNVIHLGDIFFNGLYPYIDGGSGGSVDGTVAAVDKVLALARDDTKLIPGHGPLASKADLRAYRAMLDTINQRVKALVASGKTLEQTLAAKPSADFDAVWGNGFMRPDRFVESVWKMSQPTPKKAG